MVIKNNLLASEEIKSLVLPIQSNQKRIDDLSSTEILSMMSRLSKRAPELIPDSYLAELNEYIQRNSVAQVGSKHFCCHRCLKAHSIKKANEYGLGPCAVYIIYSLLNCESGHEGYYLDGDDLVST